MENKEIEEVESMVIRMTKVLSTFRDELNGEERSPHNYSHLGTLDCNLGELRRMIDAIEYDLAY